MEGMNVLRVVNYITAKRSTYMIAALDQDRIHRPPHRHHRHRANIAPIQTLSGPQTVPILPTHHVVIFSFHKVDVVIKCRVHRRTRLPVLRVICLDPMSMQSAIMPPARRCRRVRLRSSVNPRAGCGIPLPIAVAHPALGRGVLSDKSTTMTLGFVALIQFKRFFVKETFLIRVVLTTSVGAVAVRRLC